MPDDVSAPSVKRRQEDHATAYAHLRGLGASVSNTPSLENAVTILPSDLPAQSVGEAALQLVIEAFATKQQGKLFKVDPVIHFSLQALNAYRVWKIDPHAVIAWFPRVYELLRRIHDSMPPAPPRS